MSFKTYLMMTSLNSLIALFSFCNCLMMLNFSWIKAWSLALYSWSILFSSFLIIKYIYVQTNKIIPKNLWEHFSQRHPSWNPWPFWTSWSSSELELELELPEAFLDIFLTSRLFIILILCFTFYMIYILK